ncbi:flagellar hook-basal body complex protein [Desulfovibrio desulfuricans]|uniref:Flagellar hook protein FlgE n=1 Tax=Desulfovibrio desulfuricans TaxID=876 RepID=A0A4P7UJ77_DESDE|nr:flagellar hook-basal body complex protein [Desulfovibrio desulfuricans]QCC85717.1 flagellar hook-basal body complex protein [Desulfovibrio desulfuricans]
MSLSSSMWTSVSGLMAHGNKMNIVGNNIANVSTLAYKGQRADFSDYLYTDGGSVSGTTQIGQGVSTYAVLGDFSQGSFESTNSGSDLAIDGNGYFKVRNPNSEQMYYTRAGDFYFNANRAMQNPEGMIMQGWEVDNTSSSVVFNSGSTSIGNTTATSSTYKGSGSPKDIVLDSWNLPPKQTQSVSFTMQLSLDAGMDKTTSATNPMSALFMQWDGTSTTPLADSAYATQSSLNVYDEGGTKHNLTVYYDKVDASSSSYTIQNLPSGYSMYEYMVTIPPSEDNRTYGGTVTYDAQGNPILTGGTSFKGTSKAGVLMTGQLIFNASGQLVNQTAYTYGAQDTPAADTPCNLNPSALASWQPTKISSNGLPVFNANFTGTPLSNSVSETAANGGTPYSIAEKSIIELNLGLKDTASVPWNNPGTATSLASLTVAAGNIDYATRAATMATTVRGTSASVAAAGNSSVRTSNADGYPAGVLNNFSIDTNGVIYGKYDNNQTMALYQISMYDFDNLQGLYREGNNLYSETKESGVARQGVAGDNGFGSTKAYNIEQSNVDMSREFVQMIATQRGFQANSKSITTVDSMLETVIGMKR